MRVPFIKTENLSYRYDEDVGYLQGAVLQAFQGGNGGISRGIPQPIEVGKGEAIP